MAGPHLFDSVQAEPFDGQLELVRRVKPAVTARHVRQRLRLGGGDGAGHVTEGRSQEWADQSHNFGNRGEEIQLKKQTKKNVRTRPLPKLLIRYILLEYCH